MCQSFVRISWNFALSKKSPTGLNLQKTSIWRPAGYDFLMYIQLVFTEEKQIKFLKPRLSRHKTYTVKPLISGRHWKESFSLLIRGAHLLEYPPWSTSSSNLDGTEKKKTKNMSCVAQFDHVTQMTKSLHKYLRILYYLSLNFFKRLKCGCIFQ